MEHGEATALLGCFEDCYNILFDEYLDDIFVKYRDEVINILAESEPLQLKIKDFIYDVHMYNKKCEIDYLYYSSELDEMFNKYCAITSDIDLELKSRD